MRVAVVGASGLVGTEAVEALKTAGVEAVPIVGSTGSSWRLMSQGIEPRVVSVLNAPALRDAIRGCTHVLNCTRGGESVMFDGLRNLLSAAREARVHKFVHLSSVAVYGDPPPPEAEREDAPARPARGSYGDMKLRQDRMVQRAARSGLPALILCPPNIIGPESYFLLQIANGLLRGRLPLVEEGRRPCNTVDVRNLAHACRLALESEVAGGQRMFIVDEQDFSWRDIVEGVRVATRCELRAVPVTEAFVRAHLSSGSVAPGRSVWRALRHMVSSDVRQAIRKDPLLASIDGVVRGAVAKLGGSAEDRLRLMVEGPVKVSADANSVDELDLRLAAMQFRQVRHRSELAAQLIGYRAPISVEQSLAAFAAWIRVTRGMDRGDWDIRSELFGYADETGLLGDIGRHAAAGSD